MERLLKITLAVILFLCLAKMPYGYFQFVRFSAFACFSYFAFLALSESKQGLTALFIGLAVLFQPFFKISLGRELWNIVDVVVGIGILLSVFIPKNSKSS
jgi:hypothetical protein